MEVIGVGANVVSVEVGDGIDSAQLLNFDDEGEVFIDFFHKAHTGEEESQFLRLPAFEDQVNLVQRHNALPRHQILTEALGFAGVRVYNVGRCSALLPWRLVFNQVESQIDMAMQALAQQVDTIDRVSVGPGQITLNPLMRLPDEPDGVRLNIPLVADGDPFGEVTFNLILEIDLTANNGSFQAQTSLVDGENISSNIWADLGLAAVGTDADSLIGDSLGFVALATNQGLLQIIAQNNAGLPVTKRVHVRPEGLELVLAEDEDDPLFAAFEANDFCARPAVTDAEVGYSGSYFQFSRSRVDPPAFVD